MASFWGDLPTWLTTLAIIFAGIQLWHERKDRQARAAREQHEREMEIREQAATVAAWPSKVPSADVGTKGKFCFGVLLLNQSGLPIRNMRVVATLFGNDSLPPLTITILPPGAFFVGFDRAEGWDFARSSDDFETFPIPLTGAREENYKVDEISFRDVNQRRWQINRDGLLAELTAR